MELRLFTEPQSGASYDDLLAVALAAERLDFGAFFRSDHYLAFHSGVPPRPGLTDAWTTLAALARDTSTIRLGTLMSAATFRLPGPLAVTVTQVDQMSGGRVELGIGAAWQVDEHRAFGIPFPPTGERLERLAEQFEILTGLWRTPRGEHFSFHGHHYQLEDNPALLRPVQQPHPPVIVGGLGAVRTPALAARFADEYNVPFASVDQARRQFERVWEACAAAGRDPLGIDMSVALTVCCGRDSTEIATRRAATGRDAEELRQMGATGTPEEVVATLRAYAAQGAKRAYLQLLDVTDFDQIELIAEEVMPHVRAL
jgi:F420-dependent oxidoreductase-like protein